jgi:hypothetical protein
VILKKYYIVRRFSKSNRKIEETETKSIPQKHIMADDTKLKLKRRLYGV